MKAVVVLYPLPMNPLGYCIRPLRNPYDLSSHNGQSCSDLAEPSIALDQASSYRVTSEFLRLFDIATYLKKTYRLFKRLAVNAKLLSLGYLLIVISTGVYGKWDIAPGASVQELYSSNIDLMPSGFSQTELVTEVAPSVLINNNSQTSPIEAFYRAQGVHYAHNSRSDKLYHQALISGKPQFFKERLTLDLKADHGQTVLFPSNQVSVDNISGTQRTNVTRALIGPEFRHHLGRRLKAIWGYTFGRLMYDQAVNDVNNHQAKAHIETDGLHRLYFSSDVNWDQTQRDNDTLSETFEGLVTAGFQVSAKLRPYASWGYEDYRGQLGFDSLNGTRWHVGVLYAPSERMTLNGYYGQRSFGDDIMGSMSWVQKYQSFSARYQQSITNYYQTQLEGLTLLRASNLGLTSVQFQPELRQDVFVRKVFSVTWQVVRPKLNISVTPYYEKRKPSTLSEEERGIGVNAQLMLMRSKKLSWTLLGGVNHQKLVNTLTDKRYQVAMLVGHRLTRNTQVDYKWQHIEIHRQGLPSLKEDTLSFIVSAQSNS